MLIKFFAYEVRYIFCMTAHYSPCKFSVRREWCIVLNREEMSPKIENSQLEDDMSTKNMNATGTDAPQSHWPLLAALALALVLVLGTAQAFAQNNKSVELGGGYSGPGPALVTVEQAKGMRDDARVALKGNIIQSLGGKHYTFKDATGTITVEISQKRWQGQNIGPDDLVEIHGEIDKDWTDLHIEVKRIIKR